MHVYALWVVTGITLTAAQQDKIDQGFADLRVNNDPDPCNNVHARKRTDGQAWLVEAEFDVVPTKLQIATALANRTGFTVTQINTNSTLTAFVDADKSVVRAQATAYLLANGPAWGDTQAA